MSTTKNISMRSEVYRKQLKDTEENETNMGSQFTGSIYNNMGCATQVCSR